MIDPQAIPAIEEKVNVRWERLATLAKDNTAEGLKFLNLVQLAGIGGTLSFMGATKTVSTLLGGAVAAFFAGVTCIGIVYFLRFFYFEKLINGWNSDTAEMFKASSDMTWGKVCERDRLRTKHRVDWALVFAILSLTLFVVGGILGFSGVISYINKAGG